MVWPAMINPPMDIEPDPPIPPKRNNKPKSNTGNSNKSLNENKNRTNQTNSTTMSHQSKRKKNPKAAQKTKRRTLSRKPKPRSPRTNLTSYSMQNRHAPTIDLSNLPHLACAHRNDIFSRRSKPNPYLGHKVLVERPYSTVQTPPIHLLNRSYVMISRRHPLLRGSGRYPNPLMVRRRKRLASKAPTG